MQSRSRLTALVASLPAVSLNYGIPAVAYRPPSATSPSVSTNRYVENEEKDLSYSWLLPLVKTILKISQLTTFTHSH